ncbi:MAG: hypothetical protein R3C05_15395 [Pirellulaceae bacterium]
MTASLPGGDWNFDKQTARASQEWPGENTFHSAIRAGQGDVRSDGDGLRKISRSSRFADAFAYPVTTEQAQEALNDLQRIACRDSAIIRTQWSDTDFLNHSRLSAAINVHLIDPLDVIAAAVNAFERDAAPINSVGRFCATSSGWRSLCVESIDPDA